MSNIIKEFFIPVRDESDMPRHLAEKANNWHCFSEALGYSGPVAWLTKSGFDLIEHAPLVVEDENNKLIKRFMNFCDTKFKNDEPTAKSVVFFVPRIIAHRRNAEERKARQEYYRNKFNLPSHHLTASGSASLVGGLILAHLVHMDEIIPICEDTAYTDTMIQQDWRVIFQAYYSCNSEGYHFVCSAFPDDKHRGHGCGIFPIGIERLD